MLDFKIDREKCISCGGCAADCPALIIDMQNGYPLIHPSKERLCYRCQHCLAICPTAALSILGRDPRQSTLLAGNLPRPEQLATLIRGRRAVRRYLDENLDPGLIHDLLQTAGHAPTGHNARRVTFSVVEDREVMAQLREVAYRGIKEAVDKEQLPARLSFFRGFVQTWEQSGIDVVFRGAPHLLITSAPKRLGSPEADCLIALSSFELLAQCQGIGTLWNALATWTIEKVVPQLRTRLGIPDDHMIGYCMSFGLPAINYHRTVQHDPPSITRITRLKEEK
ncbi:nitroreductase family protein [Geopsychrobacter electrodiphilus]|uniref:nitroreductase family protein n=1 Tax=Geopsychrobacter electrodiphilus TaxID=225196 RepID=UPI00037AC1D1|nr:nitroreductase family protein [Geopsychrobacter electrodiphilus]